MPQQTAFSYWRSAHTLISDVEDYKETTILNLTNLGEETQVTIQPYLHLHPRAGVLGTIEQVSGTWRSVLYSSAVLLCLKDCSGQRSSF